MRIESKACRLFLLVVFLITVPLFSQLSLAQEGETGLTLTLLSSRYSYHHEVTNGKDNSFYLELRNTSDKTITNIRLSSDKPADWIIDFSLEEIDYLSPGNFQTVDVNIKPALKAIKREHRVTFIAEANEMLRVESTSWVTVKATSPWPWIGAGIVLAIIAAFIFIFMHFDRQK